jgi:intracellular multiplication protein IcmP
VADKADNTLHENAIGWGILLVVLAVLIWLFWYYFHTEVRDLVRWIRYGEMWLISWFVGDDYRVFYDGNMIRWQEGYTLTPRFAAEEMNFNHLSLFAALAMQPFKSVIIAILGAGALWCMFSGPNTHNRQRLGLEGLINRQKQNFPVIAPFAQFNPSKQPPRPPGSPVPAELPLFAEALGPEEWLAYYQIPVPDGKIDEAAATREFQKQLGARWKGPQALKPYEQILLAAFCLKAARKRSDADSMLGRIAMCWSAKDGLKLSRDSSLLREARAVLKNRDLAGKTMAQCNRHAFVTTAMLRALAFAREEGGVLAPAQFVWLRAYDRRLWYPLNNMGRQSFHAEALGAMAHFKAERLTQRPIPMPKVENAVSTLVEYMKSLRARPIPQLDYSASEKRGIKKAV